MELTDHFSRLSQRGEPIIIKRHLNPSRIANRQRKIIPGLPPHLLVRFEHHVLDEFFIDHDTDPRSFSRLYVELMEAGGRLRKLRDFRAGRRRGEGGQRRGQSRFGSWREACSLFLFRD